MRIPHNPKEILAIVDEKDEVIGKDTRENIHARGEIHREVYVHIISPKKGLLLQKRKDNLLWDHPVGGHVPFNENYLETAIRESQEELGLKVSKEELIEIEKEKTSSTRIINNRFAKVFLLKKDIPLREIKLDKGEIIKVKYFGKIELLELLKHPELIGGSAQKIIEKHFIKKLN